MGILFILFCFQDEFDSLCSQTRDGMRTCDAIKRTSCHEGKSHVNQPAGIIKDDKSTTETYFVNLRFSLSFS